MDIMVIMLVHLGLEVKLTLKSLWYFIVGLWGKVDIKVNMILHCGVVVC